MLVFFHVLLMFIAFALTTGPGVMLALVADSGDAKAIAVAGRVNRPLSMIGGISLLLGIVCGFGAASMLGYPLASTWLVVTYVCVAAIIVLGFGVFQPWAVRLRTAAEAGDSARVAQVAHQTVPRVAGPLTSLLWLVIIAMMVLKP